MLVSEGHSTGNESIAVVEFAPFQKVPNEKKKADSRANTIERGAWGDAAHPVRISLTSISDEDYISFLESLKEVSSKPFDTDTLETLSAFLHQLVVTSSDGRL